MTARKMILLTLAVLLPCGFVILLTRFVLRSSFAERFLKGATALRKLAFLVSAVLAVAALTAGCGGGSQTTQPLAPRSVSLSIRDNPPAIPSESMNRIHHTVGHSADLLFYAVESEWPEGFKAYIPVLGARRFVHPVTQGAKLDVIRSSAAVHATRGQN